MLLPRFVAALFTLSRVRTYPLKDERINDKCYIGTVYYSLSKE